MPLSETPHTVMVLGLVAAVVKQLDMVLKVLMAVLLYQIDSKRIRLMPSVCVDVGVDAVADDGDAAVAVVAGVVDALQICFRH